MAKQALTLPSNPELISRKDRKTYIKAIEIKVREITKNRKIYLIKLHNMNLTEEDISQAMKGLHILEEANKICNKLLSINEELVTLAHQKAKLLATFSKNRLPTLTLTTKNGANTG